MEAKKAILTRNRILKSAIELFISSGFEKATMREIAKKAGISPGAIYYYFKSKERILNCYKVYTFLSSSSTGFVFCYLKMF